MRTGENRLPLIIACRPFWHPFARIIVQLKGKNLDFQRRRVIINPSRIQQILSLKNILFTPLLCPFSHDKTLACNTLNVRYYYHQKIKICKSCRKLEVASRKKIIEINFKFHRWGREMFWNLTTKSFGGETWLRWNRSRFDWNLQLSNPRVNRGK